MVMAEQIVPLEAEITLLQRHQWIKRRVEPRYQCGPATPGRVVRRSAGEAPVRVWVLNLSRGGVGLQCPRPLEPDTLVVVHLRSTSQDRFYELPARVIHT